MTSSRATVENKFRVFSFPVQDIPDNRKKARVKDLCVQWLNKWLAQFRQHIRSLAGKISRAQAGSVVK